MRATSRAALVARLLAALALAAGCSPAPPPSALVPGAPSATAAPATGRPAPSATSTGPAPSPERPDLGSARVAVRALATGLASPVLAVGAGDGSGRLLVLEQAGRVRLVGGDGAVEPTPYLDLSDRIASGGERGLLGLALAPGFGAGETRLYVHYTDRRGDTTVAELRASPGWAAADPATLRVLLTERQPYPNHNGGWIGFDPGGRLLIALGDGGGSGDPGNRASDLASPLGKILRIDPLAGPSGGLAYALPADNPFLATPGARPEILHLGLRNPYRASVDPATGARWIGDVGQSAWEELDTAPAGAAGLDFGWRRWEGRHCYSPPAGCDPSGVTMPVAEYGHDRGCAVVGGVVYRGRAIPALRGAYLFGDYCSGTLWAIDAAGGPQEPVELLATGLALSSISADGAGEVVLTDLSGTLARLVPTG